MYLKLFLNNEVLEQDICTERCGEKKQQFVISQYTVLGEVPPNPQLPRTSEYDLIREQVSLQV